MAEARSELRRSQRLLDIVRKVQGGIESAMGKLAALVKAYAHSSPAYIAICSACRGQIDEVKETEQVQQAGQ